MALREKVNEAAEYIKSKCDEIPDVAFALGSGMNNLLEDMESICELSYSDLPHFVKPTVASHVGKLIIGKMQNKVIYALLGRFHYYEGYSMEEITFPVYVLNAVGVKNIFFLNAVGALNASYRPGDVVLINDHIYLQPQHPLRGPNDDSLGTRFPDQRNTYDKKWIQVSLNFAKENRIRCHEGVYTCFQGPTYETPAEYRYLKMIGGDVVGMSTIPEVIVAHYLGMRIACLSIVANVGSDEKELSHSEVVSAALQAVPEMKKIILHLLPQITDHRLDGLH